MTYNIWSIKDSNGNDCNDQQYSTGYFKDLNSAYRQLAALQEYYEYKYKLPYVFEVREDP